MMSEWNWNNKYSFFFLNYLIAGKNDITLNALMIPR